MRIAITTSSTVNPYAVGLVQYLINIGFTPICIILIDNLTPAHFRSYLRHYGWLYGMGRILQRKVHHFPRVGLLCKNFGEQNWGDPYRSVLSLANLHHIRILRVHKVNSFVIGFIKNNIDIIVNAGGGLFGRDMLTAPRVGIINAHMGMLPKYRGINTVRWSVFYRDKLEITSHFLARNLDEGDILIRRPLAILDEDKTIPGLRDRATIEMVKLMGETILRLASNGITPIKQLPDQGRQYYVMHPRLHEVVLARANFYGHRLA